MFLPARSTTDFALRQGGFEVGRFCDRHIGRSQPVGSATGTEHAFDLEAVQRSDDFRRRQATVGLWSSFIHRCRLLIASFFSGKDSQKYTIMTPFTLTPALIGPYAFSKTNRQTLNDKLDLYFQDFSFVPLFIQVRPDLSPRFAAND